ALEATLDRLGAHVRLEVEAVAVLQLVEDRVLRLQLADLEVAELVPNLFELLDLLVVALAGLRHLLLGGVLDLALLVGLGAFLFAAAFRRAARPSPACPPRSPPAPPRPAGGGPRAPARPACPRPAAPRRARAPRRPAAPLPSPAPSRSSRGSRSLMLPSPSTW